MGTLTVYLPAIDRTVSLRAYMDAVKLAKANLDRTFKHGFTCWWPCTGREIVEQWRRGIDERVSLGIPHFIRSQPTEQGTVEYLASI